VSVLRVTTSYESVSRTGTYTVVGSGLFCLSLSRPKCTETTSAAYLRYDTCVLVLRIKLPVAYRYVHDVGNPNRIPVKTTSLRSGTDIPVAHATKFAQGTTKRDTTVGRCRVISISLASLYSKLRLLASYVCVGVVNHTTVVNRIHLSSDLILLFDLILV
jgi:hypothetical protein